MCPSCYLEFFLVRSVCKKSCSTGCLCLTGIIRCPNLIRLLYSRVEIYQALQVIQIFGANSMSFQVLPDIKKISHKYNHRNTWENIKLLCSIDQGFLFTFLFPSLACLKDTKIKQHKCNWTVWIKFLQKKTEWLSFHYSNELKDQIEADTTHFSPEQLTLIGLRTQMPFPGSIYAFDACETA